MLPVVGGARDVPIIAGARDDKISRAMAAQRGRERKAIMLQTEAASSYWPYDTRYVYLTAHVQTPRLDSGSPQPQRGAQNTRRWLVKIKELEMAIMQQPAGGS